MCSDLQIVKVDKDNCKNIRQAVMTQNAFMQEMMPCHFSLAEIEEGELLAWQTVYTFALETLDLLGQCCLEAIDNDDYALASLSYTLGLNQHRFTQQAQANKSTPDTLPQHYLNSNMAALIDDCTSLENLLHTHNERGPINGLNLCENVLSAARAAAHMAAGKLKAYYCDERLAKMIKVHPEKVVEITGNSRDQLLISLTRLWEESAEKQSLFLIHFNRMYYRSDSPWARQGASIAARQDLQIATALVQRLNQQTFM